MRNELDDWSVTVAVVARAHGIRGEVLVHPLTDYPERLTELNEVCLVMPSGDQKLVSVEKSRVHQKGVLLLLAGTRGRTAAEQLSGAQLRIRPESRRVLEEDSYFIDDLIGMEVVTTDGRVLGEVSEVLQYPANDVYVVGGILIPAIADVVVSVDIDSRKIIIEPVEGLAPELGI